jgi:hypothetical protein
MRQAQIDSRCFKAHCGGVFCEDCARAALAKALRSHYVRLKSSLDSPPLMAVGTEVISL